MTGRLHWLGEVFALWIESFMPRNKSLNFRTCGSISSSLGPAHESQLLDFSGILLLNN